MGGPKIFGPSFSYGTWATFQGPVAGSHRLRSYGISGYTPGYPFDGDPDLLALNSRRLA